MKNRAESIKEKSLPGVRGGVKRSVTEGLLTLLDLHALPGGPTFIRQSPPGHAK